MRDVGLLNEDGRPTYESTQVWEDDRTGLDRHEFSDNSNEKKQNNAYFIFTHNCVSL